MNTWRTIWIYGVVALSGCATHAPVSLPSISAPRVLRKIVIAPDVPDATLLCFYLTPMQSFEHPMTVQPLCRETIGELRALYIVEQRVER